MFLGTHGQVCEQVDPHLMQWQVCELVCWQGHMVLCGCRQCNVCFCMRRLRNMDTWTSMIIDCGARVHG